MKKWQKYVWWISVAVYAIFNIVWIGKGTPSWWAAGLPVAELIIAAIIGQPWKKPESPA